MPKREPVRLKRRDWALSQAPTVMGIDPGFAMTGVATLTEIEGTIRMGRMELIETKKTSKKLMRDLRVSADDYQRIRQIYQRLAQIVHDTAPVSLAYEVYQPFTGRMRSSSWKVARVEGVIVSVGVGNELLVLPFLPMDLKRGLTGKKSASKEEIQEALISKVVGFEAAIRSVPKTKREHMSDATGYAFLAFEEMRRMRQMVGM